MKIYKNIHASMNRGGELLHSITHSSEWLLLVEMQIKWYFIRNIKLYGGKKAAEIGLVRYACLIHIETTCFAAFMAVFIWYVIYFGMT